jgi:hypothetical protein
MFYLAEQECEEDKDCLTNLKKYRYLNDEQFNNILDNYNKIKSEYNEKINFYNVFTNAVPTEELFKYKFFTILESLKEIWKDYNKNGEEYSSFRNINFKNSFFSEWNIYINKEILSKNIEGNKKEEKLYRNFNRVFLMNLPNTSDLSLTILQDQLNTIVGQKEEHKKLNMDFMKINSMSDKEKQKNLNIFQW